MSTHALYRFFDAGGDLLYVGVTNDPGRRWGRHANDKPWWHEVDRIEIERYPDRESVLAAERKAIQEEHPRYNVAHVAAVLPPTVVEDRPRHVSCECGEPATILYVLYRDLAEHASRVKKWKSERSSSGVLLFKEFLATPDLVPWTASCDAHVVDDGHPYEFPYPRTWKEWAARTAHLLETKDWVISTNWYAWLYGVGAAGPENLTKRADD